MDIQQILVIIATAWAGLGILFFTFIYSERIKQTCVSAANYIKELWPEIKLAALMLSGFIVPLAVSLMSLFF